MDGAQEQERQLVPRWAPELVILSYCISWLGAYTSTQIIIHAKYTTNIYIRWTWMFLASLAFGFCAIWSMHFVGMLACRLDVDIRFDIPLTILSAFVAVLFTFAALGSADLSETFKRSHLFNTLRSCLGTALPRIFPLTHHDLESGYEPIAGHDDHTIVGRTSEGRPSHEESDELSYEGEEDDRREGDLERRGSLSPPDTRPPEPSGSHPPARGSPRPVRTFLRHTTGSASTIVQPTVPLPSTSTSRAPAQTAADSTSIPVPMRRSTESDSSQSMDSTRSDEDMSATTLESTSWGESLHVGLSRETRMRIKAQTRDRPMPTFGWHYWMKAHYKAVTAIVAARAAIWGLAIVFMHYCGMWAMEIPGGRISWNIDIVILSYLVTFLVCFIACIAMVHMDVHFGRQVAFSTTAAFGICAMHYTGMAAATFYTYSPPDPSASYPMYLPITIIGVAFFVCVVSNATLAHNAINSRNRMAEMILTKRRLWRIMAEKEAAEQANELKQQFISVASHEIRTPLHTVNGYCELLGRTNLMEEQSLYVTSIQQACHAINIIAGNVLDFSKLDRNNLELSAHPILMNMRKMAEDLARITEARGLQPGEPGIDVIVSIPRNVPDKVYLDETYTFRVLMNLLSNAQKFTETGHICVMINLVTPEQLLIRVSDTGCGIPKNFRSALFEPFRQADTSLTRPRQGTGLGLSIVKHLVQRMSGSVEVDTTEGEGSTFTIMLPIAPVLSSSAQPSPVPPLVGLPTSGEPQKRKRIRVVNRHKKTESLLVELWSQHGHVAFTGDKEMSAQELLTDIDVVWTDLESVVQSVGLRSIMRSRLDPPSTQIQTQNSFRNWGVDNDNGIPLFIVYSERPDLSLLEPELSSAPNVVLVKRPIIMHNILEMVEDPQAHMGSHLVPSSPKVRFVISSPPDRDGEEKSDGEGAVIWSKEGETLTAERENDKIGEGAVKGGAVAPQLPSTPSATGMSLSSLQAHSVIPTSGVMSEAAGKQKVLLVEDNLVNQRLGCRLLEKLGYEVFTANDGAKAIVAVQKHTFCACLMDCQMPVLDGFAATRQIREMEGKGELSGHIPIIALTANVTQDSEAECRSAGMDHFLPKPLKIADLDAALKKHGRHTPHL